MSESVRDVDLLFEQETSGREEFKKMIHAVFKVRRLSYHACSSQLQTSDLHATSVTHTFENMLAAQLGQSILS